MKCPPCAHYTADTIHLPVPTCSCSSYEPRSCSIHLFKFSTTPVAPTSSLIPAHFSSATSCPLHALPFPTLYCHPNSYSLNLFPSSLLWWVPGLTPQPPLRPSCSLSVLHSDLLIVHSKKCAEWHLCSMRCASRQEEHKSKQEGVYLLLCPGGAYDQLRG